MTHSFAFTPLSGHYLLIIRAELVLTLFYCAPRHSCLNTQPAGDDLSPAGIVSNLDESF